MGERLRIELRFKNATLYNALRHKYPPTNFRQQCADLQTAAKDAGIRYETLAALLSLGYSAWGKNGELRLSAERLSLLLEVPAEELFPMRLYSRTIPKTLAKEIDAEKYLTMLEATTQKLLPRSTEEIETPLSGDMLEDLRKEIDALLHQLTPREERVIRSRMDGETKNEIGQKLQVSSERIRQIEANALRKLRHPLRSRRLRKYL